jgi:hypothetical protein
VKQVKAEFPKPAKRDQRQDAQQNIERHAINGLPENLRVKDGDVNARRQLHD